MFILSSFYSIIFILNITYVIFNVNTLICMSVPEIEGKFRQADL